MPTIAFTAIASHAFGVLVSTTTTGGPHDAGIGRRMSVVASTAHGQACMRMPLVRSSRKSLYVTLV
jgi:hypothetical protein